MVVDDSMVSDDAVASSTSPIADPAPNPIAVSVVVVAYGDEPWLERSVSACLESVGIDVEVLLVDNGCTDGAVDRLESLAGVTVVRPSGNLGFAGGCNLGAGRARHGVLALVNPDALVEPDALRCLAEVALEPDVGIATCSLRLAEQPELLNSAGNAIHFLGLSWSGAFGLPAAENHLRRQVAAASGAGMAVRRSVWVELGGFVPEFFAYQEDAELSLRVWQRGLEVVFVPEAVVVHRYEFHRNPTKLFLLDRNRLLLVLTVYGTRTLILLAPLLLAQELAMTLYAAKAGWFAQRIKALAWLIRNRRFVAERRRTVARSRRCPDGRFAPLLDVYIRPGNQKLPTWVHAAQWPVAAYWFAVRWML
jgi:GT2 family glycosyltransferase